MKKQTKYVAMFACAAVMLSSCEIYDYPVYTSGSVTVGGSHVSTSVSWTNASYDANGFPIFGYYYGRPVYGYTAAGAAIFSIAAITAACLVPDWRPASWYCGHWHYPPHVHYVSVPPHCPPGTTPATGRRTTGILPGRPTILRRNRTTTPHPSLTTAARCTSLRIIPAPGTMVCSTSRR